ncbi:MAG: 2OG-Fe(II) oxygenase [Pseudomonadota bacterium]
MQQNLSQSSQINHLSADWQKWIQDNLARGCSAESMIDAMVKQNFDPIFAGISIGQVAGMGLNSGNATDSPLRQKSIIQHNQQYIYETPRLPQSGNIIKTNDRDVRVSFRMAQPLVAVFDNILSPEECDELVRLSSIKLKRSTTIDPITGQEQVIQDRSSYGTFFSINEDEFIAKLDKRIGEVMHWPVDNGEGIQILNYKVGGEYKPHFDYFPPSDQGSAPHLAKGGQRVSTLIMYLNDVEEAGETIFPEIGLAVTPKKGAAVYFEYCNSQNQVDPMTLHGGTPVSAGEKWIATKWMRQRRYS